MQRTVMCFKCATFKVHFSEMMRKTAQNYPFGPTDSPSRPCDATPSPPPPHIIGGVPATRAYNHFINLKILTKGTRTKSTIFKRSSTRRYYLWASAALVTQHLFYKFFWLLMTPFTPSAHAADLLLRGVNHDLFFLLGAPRQGVWGGGHLGIFLFTRRGIFSGVVRGVLTASHRGLVLSLRRALVCPTDTVHDPSSRNCAVFVLYTVSIVPSFTSRV